MLSISFAVKDYRVSNVAVFFFFSNSSLAQIEMYTESTPKVCLTCHKIDNIRGLKVGPNTVVLQRVGEGQSRFSSTRPWRFLWLGT